VTNFIQFAALGLGTAAIYGLLAPGIVLIYRGSGVVNFAQGALALNGAIVFAELKRGGTQTLLALIAAVAAGAVSGVAFQMLVMRQLRRAAALTRMIATLGLLVTISSAAGLHYGSQLVLIKPFLPAHPWTIFGVTVPSDRVILYGIVVLVTAGLALGQRWWLTGLATRAAAEKEFAAMALGWSPNSLAVINWGLGGALAGLAGAFIAPFMGLVPGQLTLLVVPALAAALLARFESFWISLAGATAIGVGQSLILEYWQQTGASDALPFLAIIVVLTLTGQSLPLRSHFADRLPSLGRGNLRPITTVVLIGMTAVLFLYVFNLNWQTAFIVTFAVSTVLLSVIVLTGYAGQISLAQYAVAGLGAYIAGRLIAAEHWSFLPAAAAAVFATSLLGLVFALPALRTRGVNLAVVTLGLGVAVNAALFSNTAYTGGISGTLVGNIKIFGLDITALFHPARYGIFVLICFATLAVMVANLRRSTQGRRMIAIRENERAAAALGISVVSTKIYAFCVASAIAAVGGILIAFQYTSIVLGAFGPFQSIYALAFSVIGGLGFVVGSLFGSQLSSGGISSLLNGVIPQIASYLALFAGIGLLLAIMVNPDGIAPKVIAQWRSLGRALRKIGPVRRSAALRARVRGAREIDVRALVEDAVASIGDRRVVGRTLSVKELTVNFGGVTAVDHVSLNVGPGEIVGLVGPNGAGKTTLIDAVSGFVRAGSGSEITIDDRSVTKLNAARRVGEGVSRSWQSLELFEDVTVLDNLVIASEAGKGRLHEGLRGLLAPHRPWLHPGAALAVTDFELLDDLLRNPAELPYGRRRLVGIARTLANDASILLLDEPTSGLSDLESAELGDLLRRLADERGIGILLVEHNVALVMAICDRVVVLNFGRKIAEGSPDVVRADPDVIAAYLGATRIDDADLNAAPEDVASVR
jgi:ABC-type branched-subunit amino acid transport system ATPase component/ABC-type branched-subunit amino acid transport system permease subunit